MRKQYEAPQLTVIGDANQVVMGSSIGGTDNLHISAPDFEFEDDWSLI
ncbi:MAG: hypothetical protein ACLPW4_12110 [Candidatus Sulfotelmatobacter sp.]